ncbi:MAG: flagellar basal body-associated FliL family protein [Sulfurospirillaceae bacterium]|nr:flagellar basal body-associated FliL family protein [Sulfurospirillaceae bacterium]MDD2825289.1 flagellar basal body-associated FliL family protein [Sulfurospirillaceae bacterium]
MRNDLLLKVSLAILVALMILGFITIKFILNDSPTPMYTSSPSQIKVSNMSTDPLELSLDTIFINIHASKYKMLKIDLAFKMKSSSDKKRLSGNIENVRNAILQYLAFMDANNLDTEKGKENLKQDLIDLMGNNFSARVEAVYFKNIIISP